ncbi:MAG: hypothetical protein IIC93_12690, partial [Chloroflexi bacterium]|nr:hypothetical protein [Chloroflexota bacterium]
GSQVENRLSPPWGSTSGKTPWKDSIVLDHAMVSGLLTVVKACSGLKRLKIGWRFRVRALEGEMVMLL